MAVIHWATPSLCASLMMSSEEVNTLDSINPVEEIDSFFEASEIPKLPPPDNRRGFIFKCHFVH